MCDDILKSQVSTNERISQLTNTMNNLLTPEIETMKKDHYELKEDFLDTKTRQMCENLIFTGIDEVSLNQGEFENCEATLRSHLAEKMGIFEDIKLDRVHRLGRYRRNAYPRPIIAKFHDYKTKEMVKQKAPLTLRNTKYGVREQFPEEYERRRKVLYPTMKTAKQNNENKVKMVKDTLYINNVKYVCGPDNRPIAVPPNTQRFDRNQPQPSRTNYSGARPKEYTPQNSWTVPNNYHGQNNYRWNQNPPPSNYNPDTRPAPSTAAYNTERLITGYVPPRHSNPQQRPLLNFQDTRTDNMYQPLSESASTPGRHIVGKHQASSPLEDDQTFKKHREDSSEHEGTFVSEITINPPPSSARIIPMEQNDIPGHLSQPANTQQQTHTSENENNTPSQPIGETHSTGDSENHGIPQRDLPVNNS